MRMNANPDQEEWSSQSEIAQHIIHKLDGESLKYMVVPVISMPWININVE